MPLSADGGGTTASGGNAADGGHDRCTVAPLGMRPDSVKVEAALTIAFSFGRRLSVVYLSFRTLTNKCMIESALYVCV